MKNNRTHAPTHQQLKTTNTLTTHLEAAKQTQRHRPTKLPLAPPPPHTAHYSTTTKLATKPLPKRKATLTSNTLPLTPDYLHDVILRIVSADPSHLLSHQNITPFQSRRHFYTPPRTPLSILLFHKSFQDGNDDDEVYQNNHVTTVQQNTDLGCYFSCCCRLDGVWRRSLSTTTTGGGGFVDPQTWTTVTRTCTICTTHTTAVTTIASSDIVVCYHVLCHAGYW